MMATAAIPVYTRKLPLYDTLIAKLSEKASKEGLTITPEYKTKLVSVLNSLNPEQASQVALLLIHYYFLNNPYSNPFTSANSKINSRTNRGSKSENLPFDIKISSSGKGFSFDIDTLPVAIQALLGIYCCI